MPVFRNEVTGAEHAIVGVAVDGIGTHGTSKSSTGAGGVSDKGVGVHGVSTAGPGVRGDAEGGVGVFGASKTSTGTGGVSDSGVGVHGISKTADGVFGISERGRGVVGVSTAATGVEGNSTSGSGIHGSSKTGIAIHGVGATNGFAGVFDGNVDLNGRCRVQGVVLDPARLTAIEQQLDALKRQVAQLAGGGGHGGGGTVPSTAVLSVEARPTGGQNTFTVVVGGSGFHPGENVSFQYRLVVSGAPFAWQDARSGDASALGQISTNFGVTAAPGVRVEVNAVGNGGSLPAIASFTG